MYASRLAEIKLKCHAPLVEDRAFYDVTLDSVKLYYPENAQGYNEGDWKEMQANTYDYLLPEDEKENNATEPTPTAAVPVNNPEIHQDISNAVVTVINSVTYNGTEQKPSVTLTVDGTVISKESYTLTYQNNVNAGTAQIIITGKGTFTGSKKVSFTIVPKDIGNLSYSKITDKTYTGKEIKPSITLKYQNAVLQVNKDYTLIYTDNKETGNASITLRGQGNYTGTHTVTFRILPKKVSAFKKVKCSSSSIQLKWKKSSSVTGYQIYQYDKKSKKYKLKKNLSAKTTSYTVKKLSPYTEYRFKIRAYKKVGSQKYYGDYSKVLKVKTLLAAPKMTVTSTQKGQAVMQFKKVKNATALEFSYREGKKAFTTIQLKNIDNKLYLSKLTEGAVYTFRMRAYVEKDGKKTYGNYTTKTVTISSKGSVLNGGDYSPGSIYGPKLTQAELNQVKEKVQYFKDYYIDDSMSDYLKVKLAYNYLASVCSYAPDWSKNRANTAWGALVYGEAQCSGYARAMKALCDGIGIECYYVHANSNASNPSHQWNEVRVDGNWYILDVAFQCFLVSDSTYADFGGMDWDRQSVPSCPKDYVGEE